MILADDLHKAMEDAYRRAGEEVGYWGNYFLRSVRQNGGLTTAKKMLVPLDPKDIPKGLQALLDAGRPDLSLEALVLKRKYASLFTKAELAEARKRLKIFPRHAHRRAVPPEDNFPDTMNEGRDYCEGAVRRVFVSVHERDPRARLACLRKHGTICAACGMNFEKVYGRIGRGFIHVHHKKPLAATRSSYKLDPRKDLVPVCPNCHAMLHTSDPPLSVKEVRGIITKQLT